MTKILIPISLLLVYLLDIKNKFSNRQKQLLSYAVLDQISKTCDLLRVPYKRYIAAIALTESGGNQYEHGSSGEIGLMQIYKPTFDYLNKKYHFNFTFEDLYAIQPNIYVAVLLFKDNLKVLHYDLFNTIKAYNVGTDLKPVDTANYYLTKVLKNAK